MATENRFRSVEENGEGEGKSREQVRGASERTGRALSSRELVEQGDRAAWEGASTAWRQ